MQQLTRRVLRHKRLIAIGWILATLVGMAAAGPASEALDQRFSVPGREGWETSQEILRIYGNGGESPPLVPVVKLPAGESVDSREIRSQLLQVEERAKKAVPGSRVAGFGSTGDATFTSDDKRTAFVYVFPRRSDDPFAGNKTVQVRTRGDDAAPARSAVRCSSTGRGVRRRSGSTVRSDTAATTAANVASTTCGNV